MLAGAAGLGLLLGGGMFNNIYRFRTSRLRLQVRGLNSPIRVVQLSDLHYSQWLQAGSVREWVDATLAEQPDLIVLSGDYIDSRSSLDPAPFFEEISRLAAPLGVVAVWGNHDHVKRSSLLQTGIEFGNLGFHVLVNQAIRIRDDLQVAGIDDYRLGFPDVAGTLQQLETGVPSVFLTHNPDALPLLPADSVDLALAGHTHGGQVRLPFIGAPHTQSGFGQRFLEGWVDAPVNAYVSRGLGVTALPVRLLCPPELAVFDLLPA